MATYTFDELRLVLLRLGFGTIIDEQKKKFLNDDSDGMVSLLKEEQLGVGGSYHLMQTILSLQRILSYRYFMAKFSSTLFLNTDHTERRQHAFEIDTNGVTHREAYNLLCGRSVFKKSFPPDGKPVWIRLAMEQPMEDGSYRLVKYSASYYNLELYLRRLPLIELDDPRYRNNLIKGLEKGLQMMGTFRLPTSTTIHLLEACPKKGCITIKPCPKPDKGWNDPP